MPPIELALDLLLRLVLPAAAASALVAALGAQCLPLQWRNVVVCAALAAGLLAGNAVARSLPFWPDESGWPWLLPCAMLALLIGAAAATNHCGRARRFLATSAATAAVSLLLVPSELRSAAWMAGMAAVVFGNALVLEVTARRQPGWFAGLLWSVVLAGGAAIVLVQSHSARLADGAILLASSLAAVGLVAIWRQLDLSPAAHLVAMFLPGVLLAGHFGTFSEVPSASFALVAAAPLALWAAWLPGIQRRSQRVRLAAEAATLLVPVAIAVALAIHAEGFGVDF
jgi:hypothetical protein